MRARGFIAMAVLAIAACGGSDEAPLTGVRIRAALEPTSKITQLELRGGEHASTIPDAAKGLLSADETVIVLLDDASADVPLHIDVWGLAGGTRVAHGNVDVTPQRHRIVEASTTLAPLACGGAACPPSPCTWTVVRVDPKTDVGPSSSLAVDREGGVHISYWDVTKDALNYAYRARAATAFALETVDDDQSGGQSSLAVDDVGGVHVAYGHAATELRLADRASNGGWSHGAIDAIGSAGPFPSLAVTKSGAMHVAFLRGTQGVADGVLRYAQRAAPSEPWLLEAVDAVDNAGSFASLALDGSEHPYIGYHAVLPHDLRVAERRDGVGWTKETLDGPSNVGAYTSIAIDASDTVHASYYDFSEGNLKYAFRTKGGHWEIQEIDKTDDVGRFTALAVSPSGDVHVSYYDYTHNALKYAHRASGTGGTWSLATVDTVADLGGTSIAVDSAGAVHVSYTGGRTTVSNELRYAVCR